MFLGTPLVRAGEEAAFWSAILDTLDTADWAPNFLHLRGLVEDGPVHRGLAEAAAARGRGCVTVHREARALLAGGLDPRTYYERTVRPKKRKEIRRLQSRLAELGQVQARRLDSADELPAWCDDFLALEKASWKGRAGTALACAPETEAFFRERRRRRPAPQEGSISSASISTAGRSPCWSISSRAGRLLVQDLFRRAVFALLAGRADPARESRRSSIAATSPGWTAARSRIIR